MGVNHFANLSSGHVRTIMRSQSELASASNSAIRGGDITYMHASPAPAAKKKKKKAKPSPPVASPPAPDESRPPVLRRVATPDKTGPPPPYALPSTDSATRFITPSHPSFDAAMATSYSTFVREPAATLPADFHDRFRQCLGGIQSDGLLARNDVTQPMGTGTRLAKTRVTRCLIGKPGITYRYLGTRMFAHPWSGQSCSAACASMRTLSEELEVRHLKVP